MEKKLFNYTGSTRKDKTFSVGDIVVVTKSSMSEMYVHAVWWMSGMAYETRYIDTMYNPICVFKVKSLNPPIYDHIPGF